MPAGRTQHPHPGDSFLGWMSALPFLTLLCSRQSLPGPGVPELSQRPPASDEAITEPLSR